MKHLTLKNIAATAALGLAASFAANAAPANTSAGPQFRVGSVATTTQAIQHRGHQTDILQSAAQHSYPRFRVPYPGQTASPAIEASPLSIHNAYAYNHSQQSDPSHQLGDITWLR